MSAITIVLQHIREQRCFVSVLRLRTLGWYLDLVWNTGLVILTCYRMVKGKVPSSMVGSQDVLLPTPIGMVVNQTMRGAKIMHMFLIMVRANGTMYLITIEKTAAVSTPEIRQRLRLQVLPQWLLLLPVLRQWPLRLQVLPQ